jgi:broad specificity phosphatase PhoE
MNSGGGGGQACATQRNLSERGRREAWALGTALQAGGVAIGPVWSSRWCRCLDTARLAFGHAEPAPMLDSMFNDDEAASHAKAEQTIARLAVSWWRVWKGAGWGYSRSCRSDRRCKASGV